MSFVVDLDLFRGPVDLLLYLVRKHELDVTNIPMALITDQFAQYLEVLQVLDVNDVGEFLDMASTLIEIKSRLVLPRAGEETEELEDPREDLVQRLLEYKKFRDAASMLEEQSRSWQRHLPRLANDVPPRPLDLAGQPLREVELWDLVSAFGRVVRESQTPRSSNIVYDDTPIHIHMQRIHERMVQEGRASFSQMFIPAMHKSAMVGVFLAILELVRHHHVRTQQDDPHGEIWILPDDQFGETLDVSAVDSYSQEPAPQPTPAKSTT